MSDFIGVYDNALSPELCDTIMERFEASDDKRVGRMGHGVDRSKKDSVDLTIAPDGQLGSIYDQVMDATLRGMIGYFRQYCFLLCGSISVTMRGADGGEPFVLNEQNFDGLDDSQVGGLILKLYRPGELIAQKYSRGVGGYHHWHSEIYPRSPECETLHRVLLFMYYLNSVEDGGETDFFYQQRKIRAEKGRLVIAPAGFTHTHKGHVPQSNDKYILTSWIMFQRSEAIYP